MLASHASCMTTMTHATLSPFSKDTVFTTKTLAQKYATAGGGCQILMIATINRRTDQWTVSYQTVSLGCDTAYWFTFLVLHCLLFFC